MVWHEVRADRLTAHQFEQQITDLVPFLNENWKAGVSPKTGNPIYERPVVLVIYREDHKFLLDPIMPQARRHRRRLRPRHRLAALSRPRLARVQGEARDRAARPRARAGRPPDRDPFHGHDPGHEIVQKVWPGDNPFIHDRHQIMKAVKHELGTAGRDLNFNAYADNRSLFRYDMHTLPSEITGTRSAPRRCSPPGMPRSTCRRSRTTAWRRRPPMGAISKPRARCCKSTAGCGSSTSPM